MGEVDKIYLILWESYGPKLPYFLKYRQYYAHLLPEVGRPIIILHKVKHGYFQKTWKLWSGVMLYSPKYGVLTFNSGNAIHSLILKWGLLIWKNHVWRNCVGGCGLDTSYSTAWAFVNGVMKFYVTWMAVDFMTDWVIASYWRCSMELGEDVIILYFCLCDLFCC